MPMANCPSDHAVRNPPPDGVANRTTTLSTTIANTVPIMTQLQRGKSLNHTLRCDGFGASATCSSEVSLVSQFGSTSTKVPRLAYQPQPRQIATTSDLSGALHFSHRAPVHSAGSVASESGSNVATEDSDSSTSIRSISDCGSSYWDCMPTVPCGCWTRKHLQISRQSA